MTLVIEGHSDDLITVNGDLQEEFTYNNDTDGDLIAFSDGTLLRVKFDPDGTGNWRITPVQRGVGTLTIVQTDGEDGTDRATLTGPVRWVAQGLQHHLVKNAGPALPAAWSNLLAGLALLARHQNNEISPFNCSHDTLTVMADPADFTDDELALLDKLGFNPDHDTATFTSFTYGSA